jgi:hypothetical protein
MIHNWANHIDILSSDSSKLNRKADAEEPAAVARSQGLQAGYTE